MLAFFPPPPPLLIKTLRCFYSINLYFKVILLFDYTFRIVSLGPLWNIFYEKKITFLSLGASMGCKNWQFYFYFKTLIMRCHVTILAGIHVDPVFFFGSGPVFFYRTQSDPGFVNPVRSGPDFSNPVWLDLIRTDPDFVNAHSKNI